MKERDKHTCITILTSVIEGYSSAGFQGSCFYAPGRCRTLSCTRRNMMGAENGNQLRLLELT